MRKLFVIAFCLTLFCQFSGSVSAQPADGENTYRLAEVNPRFTGVDTITSDAGRGLWVADNPDLDGDGKPEIIVTEYTKGGRVFVYEMIGDDVLEFVWASPELGEANGGGQTPRSVITGDFDNNGLQEIIVPIGYFAGDSLEFEQRGIYFYEWTGSDNDYGTEAVFKLNYEQIDSSFANANVGRQENGMRVQDIDGDGRSEFLFPPRTFSFSVAKFYILEVESGTFTGGDAVVRNEFVYEDMVQPAFLNGDGYVPFGSTVGDIDDDGFDEIMVAGWKNIGSGLGLGFIQIDGENSYTPGSLIPITETAICCVKYDPLFVVANGQPAIFLHTSAATETPLWVVEGIFSDGFVSESNVTQLFNDVGIFSIWDLGDQDHTTESAGDGFDLYISGGSNIMDIEFNGSGNIANPSSYEISQIYDLRDFYDNLGGLFNDIHTYPGMDLDRDGLRDIVASYKGSAEDTLNGESFAINGFHLFFFEWGDSTGSIDLVTSIAGPKQLKVVVPEDYKLDQNYPNPFNPSTNINFSLPIDKTVSLKIYNSLGQEVRTLVDNQLLSQGQHSVQWDARADNGAKVATGIYIYKLIFGNFSKSKQMTLVK